MLTLQPSAAPVLALLHRSSAHTRRVATLRPDMTLAELGVSSLSFVALLVDIEEQLGVAYERICRLRPHSTVAELVESCCLACEAA
jgi:hypothetical protein